jgi:hypothetical protein
MLKMKVVFSRTAFPCGDAQHGWPMMPAGGLM